MNGKILFAAYFLFAYFCRSEQYWFSQDSGTYSNLYTILLLNKLDAADSQPREVTGLSHLHIVGMIAYKSDSLHLAV